MSPDEPNKSARPRVPQGRPKGLPRGGPKAAPPGKEAPKPSARDDKEAKKTQAAIDEKVRSTVPNPDAVRTPVFPPPAVKRPVGMQQEAKRRTILRQREKERREQRLEETKEDQHEELLRHWRLDDRLVYQPRPGDKEVEVYPIREPFAYIQIIRNEERAETLYHVIEPMLGHEEKVLLAFIEETLVDVLDMTPDDVEELGDGGPETLEKYIRERMDDVIEDYALELGDDLSEPEEVKERIAYYVLRDFIGEGVLEPMMQDPWIEDVSCDGPHEPLFVYHRRYESITSTVRYRDDSHLDGFVIRLAQRAGKHVSIAEPVLDATMRDGSRLQATLAKEVSSFGSTFTIRRFRETPFSPLDLANFGTLSVEVLAYLWLVMENKLSLMYAGGTASGKTTSINALMTFIQPMQKVVTIEDTRELRVPQPNWIAGITREGFGPANKEGHRAGEIDMFQLLKNALRQRPEYIVVGEVRGAEAYNLFQAMATGHAAYGTLHADSVDAAIHRLESDPINIPRALLEALDVVCIQVQTRVGGKRVRRLKQVTEIVGLDANTREILTNEVFRWDPETDEFIFSGITYAAQRIAAEGGRSIESVMLEQRLRAEYLRALLEKGLIDYAAATWSIRTFQRDARSAARSLLGEKFQEFESLWDMDEEEMAPRPTSPEAAKAATAPPETKPEPPKGAKPKLPEAPARKGIEAGAPKPPQPPKPPEAARRRAQDQPGGQSGDDRHALPPGRKAPGKRPPGLASVKSGAKGQKKKPPKPSDADAEDDA